MDTTIETDGVVTLDELKIHLRIMKNNNLQDDALKIYLRAAISQAEFFVGYSLDYTNIRDDIKAAIMLIAGRLFANPNDSVDQLSTVSKSLLRPYRKWGVE